MSRRNWFLLLVILLVIIFVGLVHNFKKWHQEYWDTIEKREMMSVAVKVFVYQATHKKLPSDLSAEGFYGRKCSYKVLDACKFKLGKRGQILYL